MKKWLNYLPTLFIIIILASLLLFSTQGSVRRLNYTDFQKVAQQADFKESSLSISTTIIKAEGTYELNGKKQSYSVIIPNTEENMVWLTDVLEEDGGSISITDPSTGNLWMTILGQIVPLLLIGFLFYFLLSKMSGGGSANKAFEFSKSKARMESDVKVRFKDVSWL